MNDSWVRAMERARSVSYQMKSSRTYMSRTSQPALESHWTLPVMEGDGNDLVHSSASFMSTELFYDVLSPTWPHMIYLQEGQRLVECLSHTLSPCLTPSPPLSSWLRACVPTHVHTHFFMSPGQWQWRYWALTANPYSWQMSALVFDRGRK